MAYAEAGGENPVALGVLRTLLLTGYRRQEGQAMRRSWLHADRGYVVFPDTKGGAQIRAIGPAAVRVLEAQAERSEEHTSEIQSLMRTSYAVFCLKKKKNA